MDFTNWKAANGFNRPGEMRTVYQNLYDLGFGRDMHMQKGGQDGSCLNCIAYYVTNYNNADDATNLSNSRRLRWNTTPGTSDLRAILAEYPAECTQRAGDVGPPRIPVAKQQLHLSLARASG
jgi:hypothetical protein